MTYIDAGMSCPISIQEETGSAPWRRRHSPADAATGTVWCGEFTGELTGCTHDHPHHHSQPLLSDTGPERSPGTRVAGTTWTGLAGRARRRVEPEDTATSRRHPVTRPDVTHGAVDVGGLDADRRRLVLPVLRAGQPAHRHRPDERRHRAAHALVRWPELRPGRSGRPAVGRRPVLLGDRRTVDTGPGHDLSSVVAQVG